MPRHYAADYCAAKTPEAQKAALIGCPKEWQSLVKAHIKIKRERDKK